MWLCCIFHSLLHDELVETLEGANLYGPAIGAASAVRIAKVLGIAIDIEVRGMSLANHAIWCASGYSHTAHDVKQHQPIAQILHLFDGV